MLRSFLITLSFIVSFNFFPEKVNAVTYRQHLMNTWAAGIDTTYLTLTDFEYCYREASWYYYFFNQKSAYRNCLEEINRKYSTFYTSYPVRWTYYRSLHRKRIFRRFRKSFRRRHRRMKKAIYNRKLRRINRKMKRNYQKLRRQRARAAQRRKRRARSRSRARSHSRRNYSNYKRKGFNKSHYKRRFHQTPSRTSIKISVPKRSFSKTHRVRKNRNYSKGKPAFSSRKYRKNKRVRRIRRTKNYKRIRKVRVRKNRGRSKNFSRGRSSSRSRSKSSRRRRSHR